MGNISQIAPDPYVELAKAAIRAYVERGEVISAAEDGIYMAGGPTAAQKTVPALETAAAQETAPAPAAAQAAAPAQGPAHTPTPAVSLGLGALLSERAGAFVSIKKNGDLRGCIGTIEPYRSNLAEEIIGNAISACSRDPRFDPIQPRELAELSISVDVLSEAEPVDSPAQLDVLRYGVIVAKGYRRGLLLPNLEGVDTVEYQLRIALSKAGISPSENYTIQRFEVVRHDRGGLMCDDATL